MCRLAEAAIELAVATASTSRYTNRNKPHCCDVSLAEAAIERRTDLTEPELLQLLSSFAAMGRWFFDNRLLDGLTAGALYLMLR
jgi:hypothetical protein